MNKIDPYIRKVMEIVVTKPPVVVFSSLAYILLIMLIKWRLHPTADTLYFLLGAIVGVYLLDIVDAVVHASPSPFRSVVFMTVFAAVSFFVISSSTAVFAQGIVLTTYVFLLFLQWWEWRAQGNLNSWYTMVNFAVPPPNQQRIFWLFILFFVMESVIFIG